MAEKLNKISLMLLFMLIMALVQLDFTEYIESGRKKMRRWSI